MSERRKNANIHKINERYSTSHLNILSKSKRSRLFVWALVLAAGGPALSLAFSLVLLYFSMFSFLLDILFLFSPSLGDDIK